MMPDTYRFIAAFLLTVAWSAASFAAEERYGYTSLDAHEVPIYNSVLNADHSGTSTTSFDLNSLTCDHFVDVDGTTATWADITGNTADNVFCVRPGQHTGKGLLTLNFGGSADTLAGRNWLLCVNASDQLIDTVAIDRVAADACSMEGIYLNTDSDYWVIHGFDIAGDSHGSIDCGDTTNEGDFVLINGNVLDGGNQTSTQNVISIGNCEPFTIQNNVVRNSAIGAGDDAHCISISDNRDDGKVLNNEIYNCSDGIQTRRSARTVIDNNDVYVTSARYINCNSGDPWPTAQNDAGNCMCGENAIDVKGGGATANIMTISFNRVWGIRRGDSVTGGACGASGDETGDAIKIHGHAGTGVSAQFVDLVHNDVFDSQRLITLGGDLDNNDDVTIEDNRLWSYDLFDAVPGRGCNGIKLDSEVDRLSMVGNSIFNPLNAACVYLDRASAGADFLCNVLEGIAGGLADTGTFSAGAEDFNAYRGDFDSTPPGASTIAVTDEEFSDVTTVIQRWTDPTTITVPFGDHLTTSAVHTLCNLATRTAGYGAE